MIQKDVKVNFSLTIDSIRLKCNNVETYDALFHYPSFKHIYENSSYYKDDAIEYLKDKTKDNISKEISICAMQRLPLVDYIELSEGCKKLYDEKYIDESVLSWEINSNFSNQKPVVMNYENKRVQLFLNEILNDNLVSSSLKSMVISIKNGQLYNFLRDSKSLSE